VGAGRAVVGCGLVQLLGQDKQGDNKPLRHQHHPHPHPCSQKYMILILTPYI
jgi:hypothetical protein